MKPPRRLAASYDPMYRLLTKLSGPSRERRNPAENGIMRVALCNRHVQSFQALNKDLHDLGRNLAEVSVLSQC